VLYEKGVKLSGSIQKILESAEQRVAQVAADGSLLEEDEASDEA
jgi:exonuclease VII small subunit